MGTLLSHTAKQSVSAPVSRKVFNSPWHADGAPGLFDLYPPAVAFSLRRGKMNVTGKCLTIRRSTDSLEMEIGFKGELVDTDAIASFCGAGSGFVRRWYDRMGVNHAEQSSGSLQPRIYNAGSVEVNEFGLPCVRFIKPGFGIGPHLIFSPWHTSSQSYTGVYFAYSLKSAGTDPYVLGTNPLDRGLLSLHNGTTRQIRIATIRGSVSVANGSAVPTNTTTVLLTKGNRTRLQAYLNTTVAADIDVADSNTNFSMPTMYWLGSTNVAAIVVQDVCIHEFLGFVANESDQLAIRTDMHSFWRT